jgi:hypothetical protein
MLFYRVAGKEHEGTTDKSKALYFSRWSYSHEDETNNITKNEIAFTLQLYQIRK